LAEHLVAFFDAEEQQKRAEEEAKILKKEERERKKKKREEDKSMIVEANKAKKEAKLKEANASLRQARQGFPPPSLLLGFSPCFHGGHSSGSR
jgi:hypothetical protein